MDTGAEFRPMKMLHWFDYCKIDETVDRLISLGYGGIVTNVRHDRNYLHDDESWKALRELCEKALSKGLRVWLYDEKGYPSGGAGGLTLKDRPEYEAQAVVYEKKPAVPGAAISFTLPHGHTTAIAACEKCDDGSFISLTSLIGTEGNLSFIPSVPGTVYYFCTKHLYEGTHAQHNVCASRRYINVLSEEAVGEFINNTYKAYYEHLGDLFSKEPGKGIEAIFTDEPSIMAAYINEGLLPPTVDDPFDDTVPLLPLAVWDGKIPVIFRERYGIDLYENLYGLFEGDGEEYRLLRRRFFGITSELFEKNYFKQIGDYCDSVNLNFSGHVLLEESLLHHPVFEGNIFRFMSHMGIPGIDMLTTIPEGVLSQAATPKLISSAASWFGKKHVMSEVSGHMQGATGVSFSKDEMIGSVVLQRLMGVDTFPSYYSDSEKVISADEFREFSYVSSHVNEALSDGTEYKNVLLLYPIDSMMALTTGTYGQLWTYDWSEEARAVENSWLGTIDTLLKAQYGFDCADSEAIASCNITGNNLENSVTGRKYECLVIPKTFYRSPEFESFLVKCRENSVPLIDLGDNRLDVTSLESSGIKSGLRISGGMALSSLYASDKPDCDYSAVVFSFEKNTLNVSFDCKISSFDKIPAVSVKIEYPKRHCSENRLLRADSDGILSFDISAEKYEPVIISYRFILGIIFDMDGVLVDSEPAMFKAAIKGLRDFGVESTEDDFRPLCGTGERSFLGGVIEKYGGKYDDSVKDHVYAIYVRDIEKEIVLFPRIPETIRTLRSQGFRIGIASAADKIKVDANIRAGKIPTDCLDCVMMSNDVVKLKPHPDIFLKAASRMNVDPKHALVCEDAISGVKAAKSGGMLCLGITSSLTSDQLCELGADYTWNHIDFLLQ